MSESLEDVYKANETWEHEQMAMNQLFCKKNVIGRAQGRYGKGNILSVLLNIKMALNWN